MDTAFKRITLALVITLLVLGLTTPYFYLYEHYRNAVEASNKKDWTTERLETQKIMGVYCGFRNVGQLAWESYYYPAMQAVNIQNWAQAYDMLNEYVMIRDNYNNKYCHSLLDKIFGHGLAMPALTNSEDMDSLLVYATMQQEIESQDWSGAALSIIKLNEQTPTYRDVSDLIARNSDLRNALREAQFWPPTGQWQGTVGQGQRGCGIAGMFNCANTYNMTLVLGDCSSDSECGSINYDIPCDSKLTFLYYKNGAYAFNEKITSHEDLCVASTSIRLYKSDANWMIEFFFGNEEASGILKKIR